jgi:hypothetical protein
LYRLEIVDLSEVIFVSDRDGNFLKALKDFQAYPCVAHRLNKIVKKRFSANEKNKNQEDDMVIVASVDIDFDEEYIEVLIDSTTDTDVPRKALHTY